MQGLLILAVAAVAGPLVIRVLLELAKRIDRRSHEKSQTRKA